MYNAGLKSKFISEFTTSISRRNAAVTMFNAIEPYEVKLGKDVYEIDAENLQQIVDEIVGFRNISRSMRLNILRSYVRWCSDNGVPGVREDIFHITDVGSDKFKRCTVANPAHLQRFLNVIYEPESMETSDCVYRCYFWLAYAGMNEADALETMVEDVDFEYSVVRFRGREYPIYREAFPAFRNCVRLTAFLYIHWRTPNRGQYRARDSSGLLLRHVDKPTAYSFRTNVSRKIASVSIDDPSLDLSMSYYRAWLSGLFYRMYEAERAGMPADFTTAAEMFMKGKVYKTDRVTMRRKIANEFLGDYIKWKNIYSV